MFIIYHLKEISFETRKVRKFTKQFYILLDNEIAYPILIVNIILAILIMYDFKYLLIAMGKWCFIVNLKLKKSI